MGSEYKKASLRELGVELIDCDHKTPKAVEDGIPYIGIPQMDNGRINFNAKPRLISEDDFVKWTRKANPAYGDVILSRRCNSGETVYVPKHQRFALGQNLVLLRPKGDRIFPEYLRYVVKSKEWWDEVAKYLNPGAIFESLKCADIPKFMIPEPPIESQKKVVEILSSIENRIELNQQTNQTLEQMAQALFKSWFVDFDPVIDNALAAGNPIPDELQARAELRQRVISERATNPKLKPLPDGIQQLFPSEFEESELGWIPKGWRVASLAELTTELRRGISPKYLEEGGIQVINQKCIRNHEINFSLCRRNNLEIKKVTGRELLLGDVLVNSTGVGTLGRMAQINNLPEPTVVDSHVTVVRPDITKCPAHTFGQIMLTNERSVEALGEGSTGQTELSRKILSEQKVILPPIAITSRIEKTFRSYAEKQISHSVQITTLAKLRDALLPKLISGKLDISSEKLNLEQAISLKD